MGRKIRQNYALGTEVSFICPLSVLMWSICQWYQHVESSFPSFKFVYIDINKIESIGIKYKNCLKTCYQQHSNTAFFLNSKKLLFLGVIRRQWIVFQFQGINSGQMNIAMSQLLIRCIHRYLPTQKI